MLPSVTITKTDGSLGVPTQPNPTGILAIIAPRMGSGPSTPAMGTKPSSILTSYNYGVLSELASYVIPKTSKPVVLCPQDPTTAGTYGTVTYVGTGTLGGGGFITGDGTVKPVDDFNVEILFTLGGTTGTGPISYQYSVDSRAHGDPAKVYSATQALGVGLAITIPNTGVKLNLTTSKTIVTGDYFTLQATGPRLTDADVLTQTVLLGRSNLPWEIVTVEGIDASSTTVSNLDTFLAGLEAQGKFRGFIVGARLRAQDGSESEAQYLTAMTTAWGAVASIRGCVTADGGFVTSAIRGFDMVRKTTFPYSAQLLSIGVTVDAAQVSLGPVPATRTVDVNGNPQFHDEALDPGLDDQRLVTLRSFNGKSGVFITNPKIISTPGSDYVYAQQFRTMNRACELAWGVLTDELSQGIFQDQKTGFIREDSAQALENPVNNAIGGEIGRQVQAYIFQLNRDDVLNPPAVTLSGQIELEMPIYVKGFAVNAKFVRTITVSV